MGLVQFVLTMASTSFQKVWKSTAFLPIRLILGYLSFGAGFDLAKTPPIHGFIYLSPSPTATWSPWKGHGFFLTTTQLYLPDLYKSVQGVLPSGTLTYNLSHLSKKEKKTKVPGKRKYIYMIYI